MHSNKHQVQYNSGDTMGENNNFSKFAIPEDVKNVFKKITDNQVEINLPELKLPDFNYNSLYKAAENIGKWGGLFHFHLPFTTWIL